MLARFILFIGIFFMQLSCTKENSTEPTVESVKTSLTSEVSKLWSLSKLFVNGTQTTLTPGQARYTKTYKANNTWIDSDGYAGTFTISSPTTLTEVTTNLQSGSKTIIYTIKQISTTILDVEYSIASTSYRLVLSL